MMKDLNSFPLAVLMEGKAATLSSLQKGCALCLGSYRGL